MWIEPQTCSAGVVPVSFSYLEPRVMSHPYSGVSSVFVSSFPLCSLFGLALPPDQVYKICSLYVARVSEYRTSHQQTFGVQNTFHPFLHSAFLSEYDSQHRLFSLSLPGKSAVQSSPPWEESHDTLTSLQTLKRNNPSFARHAHQVCLSTAAQTHWVCSRTS
jgi:hypothetical protein